MSDEMIPNSLSVRNMVSIFENKSPHVAGLTTRVRSSKSFSKSHPNLKKIFSREVSQVVPYEFGHQDLDIIAQHLKKLEIEIQKYESYSKAEHTYFQTALVSILSEIVNVEGKYDETVAQKKKDLILIVRNLNVLLTNKLPGEQRVNVRMNSESEVLVNTSFPTMNATTSVESLNRQSSASVRNLKRLFEDKCKENEQQKGLNIITNEVKGTNIRRVMSFSGETCGYKYLPYTNFVDRNKQYQESERYIVEGVDLKEDRVIHKTNLHRYRSFKELKVSNGVISEKEEVLREQKGLNNCSKDSKGSVEALSQQKECMAGSDEIDTNFQGENDSGGVVSTGMVNKIIGKIERSISVDEISNNDRNSCSTADGDVDRKFHEIFREEITEYDGIHDYEDKSGDCTVKDEKFVVLCPPVQRLDSTSESVTYEDMPHVSVSQLIRQLENSTPDRVLHRTVSSTLPNYAVDSDTSDSLDTVINCPIASKPNGVVIAEANDDHENDNGQYFIPM